MAIIFTSQDDGKELLIGGSNSLSGVDSGGVGPFPRYSIAREDLSTSDGTFLSSKFNITITGTATLKTADNQNMLVQGQRQTAIQGEALIKILFNRQTWPMHGNGRLEIDAYGTAASNILKFPDAKLISMDLPEQNEETAGVQNLEYSFTFEAYQEEGASANTGNPGAPTDPTYCLSSAEENWDLTVNEDVFTIDPVDTSDSDLSANPPKRTYTLTHTLSAKGHKKFTTSGTVGLADDGEAWRQASQWVKTRLVSDPTEPVESDIMNNSTIKSAFMPLEMDKQGSAGMDYDLTTLNPFNHVRQVQSDTGAGSYSVTDTWIIADKGTRLGGFPVTSHTIDMEISEESGEESPEHVITVQGTIQGLDTSSSYELTSSKYVNAKTAWESGTGVAAYTYDLAKSAYTGTGTLRTTVLSETLGHNKGAGTITFSRVYDDTSIDVTGAIRQDLSVNYDNVDGTDKVVAILGVLSRAAGPIIQDMQTTRERTVSVTLDLTMDKANRASKPSAVEGDDTDSASQVWQLVAAYRPEGGYLQSKTQNWNPRTGTYNLSVAWVFNQAYTEDPVTVVPPPEE